MDKKYSRQLEDIKNRTEADLGTLNKNGYWDADSHFHFVKVYQEYMHLRDMRTLCIDRLCLEMPNKSKKGNYNTVTAIDT